MKVKEDSGSGGTRSLWSAKALSSSGEIVRDLMHCREFPVA